MACRDGLPDIITNDGLLLQTGLLGSGYSYLIGVYSMVYSGLNAIIATEDVGVEVDLVQPYATNLTLVEPASTAGLLRGATEALENHVTNRSGQSFNDYLHTRGLQVSEYFAALSDNLGHPIDPQNIQ
jgi:hypothetical protein